MNAVELKLLTVFAESMSGVSEDDLRIVENHHADCRCKACGKFNRYRLVKEVVSAWEEFKQ